MMYDVIRQAERIGANHHHNHHHSLSVNDISYYPTSFRRTDPHQAYSLYGLHASDAVIGPSCSDNGVALTNTGIYGSNYSPGSPGGTWVEHMPAQHSKWSKPAIIDTMIQWDQRQRQYGCPTVADVSGAYRRGSVISNAVTPTVSGTCGLAAAARLSHCSSPSLASSSLAAFQRQQHCTASRVQSSVTCRQNDSDDVVLRCAAPSSPHSATYHRQSADATSNVYFYFRIST